jgi:hypothetical protein
VLCKATEFYLLFPLPEGGEVDGRVIVTDDSQESLPGSEATESRKSTGSYEKLIRPDQHSESGHSISPPLATSREEHKRKRYDVEDYGASKLAGVAVDETSTGKEDASTLSPMLVSLARKSLFSILV